jgi:hypothetical protein
MNEKAVVIIPIYKTQIDENEQRSLKQCFKILGAHPIVFIKSEKLDVSSYYPHLDGHDFRIESFDNDFFSDIRGYNRLMLSQELYGRFLNYKYMLIYQLDAFVFSDQLLYWCDKEYDYIGAPWVEPYKLEMRIKAYLHYKLNIKQKGSMSPSPLQFYNRVGNGGFSLRKTGKLFEICGSHKKMIDFYNKHNANHFFNEDVFWSAEVNRRKKQLAIPDYKTAVYFSIEQEPGLALSLTGGKLPFGMHAAHVYPNVWTPIIQKVIDLNNAL